MGHDDRRFAVMSIVAYFGNKGVSLDDLFEVDERSFHSGLRDYHQKSLIFEQLYLPSDMYIKTTEGRFAFGKEFQKMNSDLIPQWVDLLASMLAASPQPPLMIKPFANK